MLSHRTLLPSDAKTAIVGRFQGKQQQALTLSASGNALKLFLHDGDKGDVVCVKSHVTHSQVRNIASFRLPGLKKDYLIASSDAGVISILEIKDDFVSVHKEAYGRSGVRRVTPGEYLAVDPKGRACMLAAVEKQKLVYVLNRQGSEITISSPLEAHTNCVTCFLVSCDVGYENPVFAAVEIVDGGKKLVHYELDLGLNHVIRKAPVDVPNSTSHVTSVPGGSDGPGGVLVFSTNAIVHHVDGTSTKIALPKSDYDNVVITSALHQSRDLFFYLLQNTKGDLFKLSKDEDGWSVLYFGTIPVCSSIVILKSAHVICLSEQGDSHVMFFESLGDEDHVTNTYAPVSGSPYLTTTQTLFSRKPVFDAIATYSDHVTNSTLKLVTCSKNSLKITCNALTPSIIVASPLPEPPSKLWTVSQDGADKYIVLTYANATLVLEIGDSVVETDASGLSLDVPTVHCGSVGENIVQVTKHVVNVISQRDGANHVTKWTPDSHVICASSNSSQLVLGLHNCLKYLENSSENELNAFSGSYDLSAPPTSVSVAPVPPGRLRSPFIAVATEDETVRIISVDPENMFETVAVQGLMANATSLTLLSVGHVMYLHMGLSNGVYVRCELDPLTGEIVNSWSKFVGLGRLSTVTCADENSILVLSRAQKTVLGHVTKDLDSLSSTGGNSAPFFQIDAISGEPLDLAHSFSTGDCPNGVIGVAGSTLKIFTVDTSKNWTEEEVKIEGSAKRLIQQEEKILTITQQPDALVSVENGLVTLSRDLEGSPTSICEVLFDGKQYFAVGGQSRDKSCGFITILSSNLSHVHTTSVEKPPLALVGYNNLLIAGVGNQMRLYALGLKQLLRKAQVELSKRVTCLDVFPGSNRVAVGDILQSVTVCVILEENSGSSEDSAGHVIYPLVCDSIQRQVTCLTFVDYQTLAVGDRFGGFTMLRIPAEASKLADEDFSAVHLRQLEPTFNATARYRFDHVTSFHLEDVPVNIGMFSGSLVVSCLLGTVASFTPVASDKEGRQLKTIEKFVAESDPGLMGRDHLKFRGYYVPVKGVVDGDMVREVLEMSAEKRKEVAEKSDLDVEGVVNRVVRMAGL
ncbi:Pre-mRNA-splicing factor RSE1 [Yarrowia sp. B02]|nr:Pre-mRNA-splicing factor RSE1 [Yarrowia sp. B02]